MSAVNFASFLDELEKIAASHGRMHISKERKGRRSMSVTTLLKREKDGTLYKGAYVAAYRAGSVDEPGAAKPPKRQGEVPAQGSTTPEQDKLGELPPPLFNDPKKKMTKEDPNRINRMDGRQEAATVAGPSMQFSDVAPRAGDHY